MPSDKKLNVWPKCRIEGECVVVEAPELTKIEKVGYGVCNLPSKWTNLFNKDGLPAFNVVLNVED